MARVGCLPLQFNAAYEAVGLDHVGDLGGITAEELADLEAALIEAGAGKAHLRKLRAAMARHTSPAQPDRGWGAGILNGSQSGGKRFAAFLSHHKAAAAMDARFVKSQLEQMLGGGAEAFLDSDNLQDLRLLLDHVRSSEVLVLFQACPQAPPLA